MGADARPDWSASSIKRPAARTFRVWMGAGSKRGSHNAVPESCLDRSGIRRASFFDCRWKRLAAKAPHMSIQRGSAEAPYLVALNQSCYLAIATLNSSAA